MWHPARWPDGKERVCGVAYVMEGLRGGFRTHKLTSVHQSAASKELVRGVVDAMERVLRPHKLAAVRVHSGGQLAARPVDDLRARILRNLQHDSDSAADSRPLSFTAMQHLQADHDSSTAGQRLSAAHVGGRGFRWQW